MTVRLSININDETTRDLKEMAERNNTTVTDIVRRAVSVYYFVVNETDKGKKLRIVDDEYILVVELL